MTYLFSLWLALAVVIAAMAIYRKMVAGNEDDSVHLGGGADSVIQHQAQLAVKLESIDKWGKTLTVIEVVFGLALAGWWLYSIWLEGAKVG